MRLTDWTNRLIDFNHLLYVYTNPGWPAPRLKDVQLSGKKMAETYWRCLGCVVGMIVAGVVHVCVWCGAGQGVLF